MKEKAWEILFYVITMVLTIVLGSWAISVLVERHCK